MSDSRWVRVSANTADPLRPVITFTDVSKVATVTVHGISNSTGVADGYYVEFDGVRTFGPYSTCAEAEDLVAALFSPYFPGLPS